MKNKNFIIGMILIVAWILIWNAFLAPDPPPPPAEDAQEQAADQQTPPEPEKAGVFAATPTPVTPTPAVVTTGPDGEIVPAPATAFTPTATTEAEEKVIRTELFTATISNRGGVLTSFIMNHYNNIAGPDGHKLELLSEAMKVSSVFHTEFVSLDGSNSFLGPVDMYEFVEADPTKITLKRVCPNGLEVIKTYQFDEANYVVNLEVSLRNLGDQLIQGEMQLITAANAEKVSGGFFKPPSDLIEFMARHDGKLETEQTFKVEPKTFSAQQVSWAGFSSKYFLIAVAPGNESETKIRTRRPSMNLAESMLASFNRRPEADVPTVLNYAAYIGPKRENRLATAGHEFDLSRDFGWFSSIARGLVTLLRWINTFTGNYGFSILVVTIIIKLVLFPLTHKSYKSMKAMSKLQPEIKALREQYKDDRNALNMKTMELYKKHRVNPASGCLPMLLQLPIFIAFYRALYSSIELRHAPFMLWIQDLSAPDPYYVTPILMGASMVITQKMTPTNADPVQAKMFLFLPVVFTFLFLSFPSGLVIYWLISNILGIAQQLYINRKNDDPAPAPAVAGKRSK